jgi:hypothetical protein
MRVKAVKVVYVMSLKLLEAIGWSGVWDVTSFQDFACANNKVGTVHGVTIGGVLYWILDLLTTKRVITVVMPSLISTLQFTRAHAKSFSACSVFIRRFLVTAPNSGCSPATWLEPSVSQSQSYFTTDGLPPISSSWRQAPWGYQYFSPPTEHLR